MQSNGSEHSAAMRELEIRSCVQQMSTLSSDFLRLRCAADRHIRESASASDLVMAPNTVMNGPQNGAMSPKQQHTQMAAEMARQADFSLLALLNTAEHLRSLVGKEPGLRISQ